MKMKMTNEQMYDRVVVLSALNEKGKLGYAIARNRRKLENEIVEYSKLRSEALTKYGSPIEGTSTYVVSGENRVKYNEELAQYNDIETEVDVMQVSIDEFLSGNLDSNQMYALDWIVDYGE